MTRLDRDLARWETGDMERNALERTYPDAAPLITLFERMSTIRSEPVEHDEGRLQELLAALPEHERTIARRRTRRSVPLAIAAALMTASVALAVPGIRDRVPGLGHPDGRAPHGSTVPISVPGGSGHPQRLVAPGPGPDSGSADDQGDQNDQGGGGNGTSDQGGQGDQGQDEGNGGGSVQGDHGHDEGNGASGGGGEGGSGGSGGGGGEGSGGGGEGGSGGGGSQGTQGSEQ